MQRLIEEFPFTTILALIGLAIGLILPSGLDLIPQPTPEAISSDPAGFLTGYVIGSTGAIIIEIISGLIGTIIMGLVGLVVDIIRNSGGGYL